MANAALRGKVQSEKMKKLAEKYKRPANVENLQVPKVEETLWRQLCKEAKVSDYILQKSQSSYALALIPIIKAVGAIHNMKSKEMRELRELITDAFKILTLEVTNNHEIRREKIKKELEPKYRGICNKDTSTTKLFGDQLQDAIKAMGDSKFNLTFHQSAKRSFLRRRGGSEDVSPQSERPPQQQQLQQPEVREPVQESEIQKTQRPKQKIDPVSNHFTWSFRNTPDNFYAGKTSKHLNSWTKVTQDKWILETISGNRVEVAREPQQPSVPKPLRFNKSEQEKIDIEIEKFLLKGIVEPVEDTDKYDNEFISNIFIRPKKDGRVRVILNLKHFNEDFMDKQHFKMETLKSAVESMRHNCFFGSVD